VGAGKKDVLTFEGLPWVVRKFLSAFPSPFIIADESSKFKVNDPMKEKDKSTRTRLIKLLNKFGERMIATGTLRSKSPLNVIDQYNFLCEGYFNDNPWAFAEHYNIMITLKTQRGKRVRISEKIYNEIRDYLKRCYIRGGKFQLEAGKSAIFRQWGIDYAKQEHIIQHKKYTPFLHQEELTRRITKDTMFVKRSDVFDVRNERFVHDPIGRPVEISGEAKRIANELIDLGFTDKITLGKAPALELLIRLQDICNGFEPVRFEGTVEYKPFKENPKLEELMSLLEEIGVDENQVTIFSSRTRLVEAVCEKLKEEGVSFARYDGKVGDKEREAAERAFESGEVQVFVANPGSSAYGLNCLGNCSYLVWMCVDGSVEKEYQARHRLLRGQLTEPKIAYKIYVAGSVEERMWEALRIGKELIDADNKKEKFIFK